MSCSHGSAGTKSRSYCRFVNKDGVNMDVAMLALVSELDEDSSIKKEERTALRLFSTFFLFL